MAATLSAQERGLLGAFAGALRARFGGRLRALVLFGSRARGSGRADSDLDVLVLIDQLTRAERGEVLDEGADLSLSWGLVLSPLVADAAAWRSELPLARAIEAEGVAL
jgi:predicted nucleotidyltransferase